MPQRRFGEEWVGLVVQFLGAHGEEDAHYEDAKDADCCPELSRIGLALLERQVYLLPKHIDGAQRLA